MTTEHRFTFAPDRRPAIHPASGAVVNLPTGLTRATCPYCGSSFTIASTDEPQRLPGRDTLFVVQRACI
jgi:hypothetical protein